MRTFCLFLVLVLSATACGVVNQPDRATWRESAVHSLDDASAALATTRTVVAEQDHDHLPVRYAITLVRGKEESIAQAESSLASLQPPDGERRRATDLVTLLGDAVDAQREVRVLIVARDPVPHALLKKIDELIAQLDRAAGELG